MEEYLKVEAEQLIQELQLKATGANIHAAMAAAGLISGWLYLIGRDTRYEKEDTKKLLVAMKKGRQKLAELT